MREIIDTAREILEFSKIHPSKLADPKVFLGVVATVVQRLDPLTPLPEPLDTIVDAGVGLSTALALAGIRYDHKHAERLIKQTKRRLSNLNPEKPHPFLELRLAYLRHLRSLGPEPKAPAPPRAPAGAAPFSGPIA